MPGRRKCQHGFSLVELLIVIALMAVVSAIAIPQFQASATNSALKEAARGVVADLSGADQKAARRAEFLMGW